MKLKTGDNAIVIAGKDKGRKGKIEKIFPKEGRVVVEGINMRKKNIRPKRSGEKGQQIEIAAPLNVSNLKLVCPKCSKGVRTGVLIEDGKKFRICKKCQAKV